MAAGLALVYVVAGKLGLELAFFHPSATPVWPPTGIALAACLVVGYRVWPAILLGAFLVNVTTAGSVATSLGIAAGNTLEGVLGAYLVTRFAGGRRAFERARTVFLFAGLAALLSTTVSATCGVTSLAVGGFARWEDYFSIWVTWWLGDAGGDLVLAPALLLWSGDARVRWPLRRALEAAALASALVLVGLLVFGGLLPSGVMAYPLEFLYMPVLLWGAFRFGPREAASAIVLLAGIAIWGTLHGYGPFARTNESLLLLQAFMAVTAVTMLTLAAVVSERGRVEEQLRRLAVVDALTGLANYRHFVEVLEGEIQRARRTERGFAVLLLDLDGLKKINDRYGHLVGSRALCRLGDSLRHSCRAVDTAARFGGDEFALILPETGEDAARQVAARVGDRLALDREKPTLSFSAGFAVYPRDGGTPEALLGAADRALYEAKAAHAHS